jgi:hypothetical protein
MREAIVINGYQLTTDFTTVGGGQCQWAFAKRGGVPFFIKRFLAPRYPVEGSPGSPATKALKLERCRAFEQHHRSVIDALQRCAAGGNLVIARDFFREGTSYYKVTDRVEIAGLTPDQIAALPPEQQLLLLKTVTHSLSIMHEAKIAHCDLRPDNVLVKRATTGVFVTKLIDLDSCYFSQAPPPVDQVAADPVYLAPEMSRYTAGFDDDPRMLTVKTDIFSLGLLFTMFTVGSSAFAAFPSYDMQYAHEFVLAGHSVPLPWDRIPSRVAPLIRRMVYPLPAERPPTRAILDALNADAWPETPAGGRLRGALLTPTSAPVARGLRGTLVGCTMPMFWLCERCETSNRVGVAACDVCTASRPLTMDATAPHAARRSATSPTAGTRVAGARRTSTARYAAASHPRSAAVSGTAIARAPRPPARPDLRTSGVDPRRAAPTHDAGSPSLGSSLVQLFNRAVREVERILDALTRMADDFLHAANDMLGR